MSITFSFFRAQCFGLKLCFVEFQNLPKHSGNDHEQLWETDNESPDVPMYANIMLTTGPGVIDWYQSMGRYVMKPNFRDYIDELLEKA